MIRYLQIEKPSSNRTGFFYLPRILDAGIMLMVSCRRDHEQLFSSKGQTKSNRVFYLPKVLGNRTMPLVSYRRNQGRDI